MTNHDALSLSPISEQQNGITAELDIYEASIMQAATDVAQNPGVYSANHFPANFSARFPREAMAELVAGECSTDTFLRYLRLSENARDVCNSFSAFPVDDGQALMSLQQTFPDTVLQRVYHSEGNEGILHGLAGNSIAEGVKNNGYVVPQITFLQNVYDVERPSDLLRPTEDAYLTKIRNDLLSERGIDQLFTMESPPIEDGEPWSKKREQAKQRQWMRETVQRAAAITDPDLADDYVFAASREIGGQKYTADIVRKIDTLGPKRLASIRRFNGIYSLADCSITQLERMALLATGDKEEIERLKRHDVIAVFRNKMGDHNNILKNVPEIVEDEAQREILFEIQSIGDIYRFESQLEALDIKPSTIVLAAHGHKGQFPVVSKPSMESGHGRMSIATIHSIAFVNAVNITEGIEAGFHGYAMHDMKGFARLVDDYMQPSRGDDDPEDAIGKKRIAFVTCESVAEHTITDLDVETGEPIKIGTSASVASQLATDLQQGGVSNVEVYGASVSVQAHKTARGYTYSAREGNSFGREHLDATKFSVEDGVISREEIAEVRLRKAA